MALADPENLCQGGCQYLGKAKRVPEVVMDNTEGHCSGVHKFSGHGDIMPILPCAGNRKKSLGRPLRCRRLWGWEGGRRGGGRYMTTPFSFLRSRQSTKQLPGVTGIFIWHLLSVRHILGVGYMLGAKG